MSTRKAGLTDYMGSVFGKNSKVPNPDSVYHFSKAEEDMQREILRSNYDNNERELNIKRKLAIENPTPIKKAPKIYVYCALCENELIQKKPVECQYNEGIYKLRYYCELCQLDYWGFSIDKLVLHKDNETKPIIEKYEYE